MALSCSRSPGGPISIIYKNTARLIGALAGVAALGLAAFALLSAQTPSGAWSSYELHDGHVYLTNYIQAGPTVREFLKVMGTKVGRAKLFGLPLQQMWDHGNTGDSAPTYYLQTDAPLYSYSFTDAWIAMQVKSLTPEEQKRLDPMITGFNPADMYAVDHIKRALRTFPGVFVGIGEFTIHKEFVSAKTAGGPASLTDPALDKIFDFAGEAGLVTLIHSDADVPFPKPNQEPWQILQLRDLFLRHPKTTVIWAHIGVGRVVRPVEDQYGIVERALNNPALSHLYFDLSWDEAAKYLVATPETIQRGADLINRFPDRFLFGTDEVGPTDQAKYLKTYDLYAPLFAKLTPAAREKVLKGNYERIFDQARRRVRAWEKANLR